MQVYITGLQALGSVSSSKVKKQDCHGKELSHDYFSAQHDLEEYLGRADLYTPKRGMYRLLSFSSM